MKKGDLYLIPTTLGSYETIHKVIPEYNIMKIKQLTVFIVENIRTARRFLKACGHPISIDDMLFFEINKHSGFDEITKAIKILESGKSVGVISEAGTPAIADPGSMVVQQAQLKKIKVIPLVGPNSIIIALMASGFNGQQFCFNGYLPKEISSLSHKLKQLEVNVLKNNVTQVFIETPFRNNKLLQSIIKNLNPSTQLCVALDLTLPQEEIICLPIRKWAKKTADLNKRPAVFLLGK